MSRPSVGLAALIAVFAGGASLGGCASGHAPRIYTLSAAAEPPSAAPAVGGPYALQLERVLVPDSLDTTDIVLRVGAHELHAIGGARWGERLSLGITRALETDLESRLPQERVTLAHPTEKAARQILVTIDAFDVWRDGHCVLTADWTVLEGGSRAVLNEGRKTVDIAPQPGSNTSDAAVVAAMAGAVRELASAVAAVIGALPPQAPAHGST